MYRERLREREREREREKERWAAFEQTLFNLYS
jgi:hypothetical protein